MANYLDLFLSGQDSTPEPPDSIVNEDGILIWDMQPGIHPEYNAYIIDEASEYIDSMIEVLKEIGVKSKDDLRRPKIYCF